MYDPITVFLIVWGLLSIGLFLLLCSLPREVPLAFVVKLVWWYYLSGKLLISPTNLNESLARYSILGYSFSSFINLNMLCHSLLACRISAEKSADNLMGAPLYIICCFSLVAFNISPLSLIFVHLITMCIPPWVYPSWDYLHSLDFADYFLSHIREVFSYYLFKYFLESYLLSSPSVTPIM